MFSLTRFRFGNTSRVHENPVISKVLDELYLSGVGHKRKGVGQPRLVIATTGGGGMVVRQLLARPGASSCLLEAIVPYDKNSCLDFLEKQGLLNAAKSVGFCSQEV